MISPSTQNFVKKIWDIKKNTMGNAELQDPKYKPRTFLSLSHSANDCPTTGSPTWAGSSGLSDMCTGDEVLVGWGNGQVGIYGGIPLD